MIFIIAFTTAGMAVVAIKVIAGFAALNAWNNLSFRSSATAITLSIAGLLVSIAVLMFRKAVFPVSDRNVNASVAFVRMSSRTGFTFSKATCAFFAKSSVAGTALSYKLWTTPTTLSVIEGSASATPFMASFAIGANT